jgi:mRNA interferase HigB
VLARAFGREGQPGILVRCSAQGGLENFRGIEAGVPEPDLVGRSTVFNIAGNKYRLIARVNYQTQRVFVLYLLTHAEYNRGAWKQ